MVEGEVMSPFTAQGMMSTLGAWLNAIPGSDIAANAIQTHNVVRPTLRGFASNELRGARRILKWSTFGLDEGPGRTPSQWAGRARLVVPPTAVGANGVDGVWLLPLGFRITLPDAADVELCGGFEWQIRVDPSTAGGPVYPSPSAATGATAGSFAVHKIRRFAVDGTPLFEAFDVIESTRNFVCPLEGPVLDDTDGADAADAAGRSQMNRGGFIWADSIPAGTYDFYLGYTAPSPSLVGLRQLDVSAFSATLEALL
jgi:hypothetical protein